MSECEHSNCKEAFEKLDDYLDRVLSEDEMKAVKVHLEKCSHCADEFQFEESVIACLKLKLISQIFEIPMIGIFDTRFKCH